MRIQANRTWSTVRVRDKHFMLPELGRVFFKMVLGDLIVSQSGIWVYASAENFRLLPHYTPVKFFLKIVFVKLRFRDGLVWTEGLIGERNSIFNSSGILCLA